MKYEVEIIFTKNKKLQSIILQTNSTDITKLTLPPSTVHVFFSEIGIYDNKTVKAYSFGRAADEREWRNEKEVLPSPCQMIGIYILKHSTLITKIVFLKGQIISFT